MTTTTATSVALARWATALRELRLRWKPIVTYQLLVGAAGTALLAPLVTGTLHGILHASGKVAVNNYDLVGFFLSPAGLLVLATAILVGLATLYLQQAGLTLLTAEPDGTRTMAATLRRVVRRWPGLVRLGIRQLGALLLALVPFALVVAAVAVPLLRAHDVNYYLHESPPEWRRALVVAGTAGAAYAAVALWLLARLALALPVLLLEGRSAPAAIAESLRLTRGRGWHVAGLLGGWWALLFAVQLALLAGAGALLAPVAARATRVGVVLLAATAFVAAGAFVGFLWVLCGHAGQAVLANRLHRRFGGHPTAAADEAGDAPLEAAGVPLSPGTVGVAALAVWAVVAAIVAYRVVRFDFREDVRITAHRGSSARAPENSLAAIRQAIADRADVAEIDVQRTADGQVVLLHDGDLMRMAGDPRRIDRLTLAQLDSIDIGSRRGAEYAGERVPTLAQVLDTARGRLDLNIELKYNRPDPELAPAVIRLVREHGATDDVTITSLDTKALADVERLAPEFRTGMIVTKSVGDVARLPVDFLSLNQAQATPKLLDRAHRAGKEVHVWTVNTRGDMEKMMERGVDNMITDHPALAVQVRAERAGLSTPEKAAIRLRRLLAR